MQFKRESQWRENRSVLRKGTSPGGQVILKGTTVQYVETADGTRTKVPTYRFLIRIGKHVSETVEGTPQDAENRLIDLLARHRNGGVFKASRMRLATFLLNVFIPDCRRRKLAPRTVQHYAQDITNHINPILGARQIDDLPVDIIEGFLTELRNERGLDHKHVKNIYGCLRAALNRAVKMGHIKEHNARHPKINLRDLISPSTSERSEKRVRRRRQAWSNPELLHFFQVAPEGEMKRAALVGCRTGMRPGELCARKWEDVRDGKLDIWSSVFGNDRALLEANRDRSRWEIGDIKTGEARIIHLDRETLETLDEQRVYVTELLEAGAITEEAAAFIFPSQGGDNPFLNPAKMYERWRFFVSGNKNKSPSRDRRKGGRPARQPLPGVRFISLYGWRHTHATELLRRKEPEKLIAERLGTSVEMIRKHYGHILAETEVAAIDSLPSYRPDALPGE